jgi:hypothetical protein
VQSSGLLHSIAGAVETQAAPLGTWSVCVVFCALVLLCTTFISHTVGAMIILPIVQQAGADMSDPHPQLLVRWSVCLPCLANVHHVFGTTCFPSLPALSTPFMALHSKSWYCVFRERDGVAGGWLVLHLSDFASIGRDGGGVDRCG